MGDLPEHAKETAEFELTKLEKIQPQNPEYHVTLKYLEFLLDLPWSKSTTDCVNVKKARVGEKIGGFSLKLKHFNLTNPF